MDLMEKIRQSILRFLRIDRLPASPNSDRYNYVNDPAGLARMAMEEARIWYIGDSNELLNYYTDAALHKNAKEPIYNRNRANYFWGISQAECSIKRVHSGIPRAIVDTLCNAVGTPIITQSEDGVRTELSEMAAATDLKRIYFQQQLPLTMALGWGAWKVDIREGSPTGWPTLQFYEARDVEFAVRSGRTVGAVFKNYYRQGGRDYVLLETRRINDAGNSCVEYELYRIKASGDVERAPMSAIPQLASLTDIEIPGYRKLLAVPCRFIYDPDNPDYGRSIYYGKYDLFDDLDQSLSQRSQTSRVSTPVEYYSPDVLERTGKGEAMLPQVYNRQYVKRSGLPDADGKVDNSIQTTQPQLNFDQYTQEQKAILDFILTGILSPATMGIDIAKKDNAEAQREKEKVTTMTRDSIIEAEAQILRELASITLDMKEYMDTGAITIRDRDISVQYGKFANPSFESLAQTLTPMWQAGAISDEMFVDRLYGDSLTHDEKAREIAAIKENRRRDDLGLAALGQPGE